MRLLALAVSFALAPPALAVSPTAAAPPVDRIVASGTLANLEVPLHALPVELHRRAVDFVERERDRMQSPWAGARLGDRVLPMVRPGDTEPTYYEIRIEDADGGQLGYFVLSTGEHDHPVPVALEEGPPRSHQLEAQLAPGEVVRRVNFFNAVSLVAEGPRGERLAGIGGFPVKVEGVGPTEARLGTWASWDELRENYAENYREAHDIMRRNAAEAWDNLRQARELAEGLQPGWFREIPLLGRGDARVRIEGAGRDLVRLERYERGLDGDEVVSVFVPPFEAAGVHPIDVHIEYGDGTTEVKHFALAQQVPAPNAAGHLATIAPSGSSSGIECSKVVMRSNFDTYVYARDGGGSTLHAKGGWIGGWEVFRLERFRENVYQLRSSGGQYVRAAYDGGKEIHADVDKPNGFTRFHRHNLGNGAVELRTFYQHRRIRAYSNGTVESTADTDLNRDNRLFLEYCSPNRITAEWAGADNPIPAMQKVRKYDQLRGNQAPNKAPCASGCGATVWAMVFGWADHMAAENHPTWRDFRRLYTADGNPSRADVAAPEFMWNDMPTHVGSQRETAQLVVGVGKIIEEIRSYLNDWGAAGCTVTGSRFTTPHIMAQARQYLTERNLSAGLTADYDGLGIMTANGRNNAMSQIRLHDRVVAIGIDWFGHYPLAYGYEHARFAAWNAATGTWNAVTDHQRFVVNMGWGKYGSANVPLGTWFAGYLAPERAKSGEEKSGGKKKGKKKGKKRRGKKKGKKRRGRKKAAGKPLPPPPNRVLPLPT